MKNSSSQPQPEAHPTVRLDIDTKDHNSSIRICFTDQRTNLPASVDALNLWRRYKGRADLENRIRELGEQFGIKRLCVHKFWGTEAMHHLAIAAYNLCVLLQRRLGQLEKCELNTLRWRLFSRAAVWSFARGKPTLKLAVPREEHRSWWRAILNKLTA